MDIKLIGRGKNGWHAHGLSHGNRCSSSGGTLEGYLSEAPDGTPIYDADGADMGTFADFVVNGPMDDPSLEPGTIKGFTETRQLAMMAPALGGSFRAIAAGALAGITSLDMVATDVYLAMLREKVPGVKFGTVRNHQAVWE